MSDRDYPITIDGSLKATPPVTPDQGQPKMDTEDSIVFDAAVDCVICFDPKDVFGSHIRLRKGINGGYTPSKVVAVGASYTVSFEILPEGQHCKDHMKIKAYSIKVG